VRISLAVGVEQVILEARQDREEDGKKVLM
jgi:hypothetical protein